MLIGAPIFLCPLLSLLSPLKKSEWCVAIWVWPTLVELLAKLVSRNVGVGFLLLFVPLPLVDASAELSRLQGVINDLQRELARLRPVQPVEPTISDDVSMALVLHNQHPSGQGAVVLARRAIQDHFSPSASRQVCDIEHWR